MAYFKLVAFGGIAPQIGPRLLGNTLAQTAENVILDSGRLVPVRNNSTDYTLSTTGQNSIYKYETGGNEYWLEWADEGVDVVPGPIAGDNTDRLYWTGESASFPRMANNTLITSGSGAYPRASYRLGIPAPTAAPTTSVTATTVAGTAISFNAASASIVIVADETITLSVAQYDSLSAEEPVTYSDGGGTVITGLADDTVYYVIKGTSPKIKLATTTANAVAGTAIDLTAVGVGTHSLTPMDDKTQTKYSTSYIYTFVSAYGEEGPPSLASVVFDKVDGQTVTVSGLEESAGSGAGRSNTNITHRRIYRSNTGSNTTAFQFVKEINMSGTSATDSKDNSQLAEVIPSTYWIGPPNEVSADYPDGPMKGLTAMPNGIFAGFTGKRVCFSDPYLPHAWPVAYRITLEEEIVGIKMAGQGLIIGTKGTPYLIAGTDPQSMSVVRIEAAQACLSKTSMVDMGPYVIYAGADGLVAAAGSDVNVITEGLISPEQWRADYYPSSLRGFLWEGRYVGLYTSGSNYGGFIFDPRGEQQNTLTTLTQTASTDVTGGFTNPDDNELYFIVETGAGPRIEKFQGATSNKTLTWKSREFVPPKPTSMGFAKVVAEAYPATLKIYGDGSLIYHATLAASGSSYTVTGTSPSFSSTTISEPVVRLPASLNSSYSIEVESNKVVNEVCIAESIDELKGV